MEEVLVRDYRMNWPMAFVAGLIAGAVVWLLSHGTPWFTSGMVAPTFMGRDLRSAGLVDSSRDGLTVLAHLGLSVCYGLIISALVGHLRGLWAVALGALVGLVLYVFNFVAFHLLQDIAWSAAEIPTIVTHFVFGAIAAGTYKGLAARRRIEA